MHKDRLCVIGTILAVCVTARFAQAEDWPRFRGPNGMGVSISPGIPSQFGADQNLVWKIESGNGSSSPIITHGLLFYTSFDGELRTLQCLDASTGKSQWKRSVSKVRDENASRPNGPATCTPVSDGKRVVVFYPDSGLICYTLKGDLLWRREVGPFYSMHGIANSPIITGGKVIVLADQLRGSHVSAYDLKTGQPVWKVDRLDGITGGYSTPSTYKSDSGRVLVLVSGPHGLFAYDVDSGQTAWSVPGVANAPITVPVLHKNRVFLCEPVGTMQPLSQLKPLDKNGDGEYALDEVQANVAIYRLLKRMDREWGNGDGVIVESEWNKAFGTGLNKGGLVAIELDDGDAGKPARVRWQYRKTVPYVASPVVYDGILYFAQDHGIVTAVDPDTGEVIKQQRLTKGGRKFYASPVAADGKIFIVDTSGTMSVLTAGRDSELLASNPLGEPCFATPAICDGRLYVRTVKTLFCFGAAENRP